MKMTNYERAAVDVASALGLVHDRNARDLLEQLIRDARAVAEGLLTATDLGRYCGYDHDADRCPMTLPCWHHRRNAYLAVIPSSQEPTARAEFSEPDITKPLPGHCGLCGGMVTNNGVTCTSGCPADDGRGYPGARD